MSENELLFGIFNENKDEYIELYNRIFFLVRMFIWKCRYEHKRPFLNLFIIFLRNEYLYEIENLKLKGLNVDKLIISRWKDLQILFSN